ncbi:MAG TPA: glycosyltransferase family 2 protein, partial [Draconibacterium sp.]|nr:glycosyltransferase family 2 protein [Draconibacterium sp.]
MLEELKIVSIVVTFNGEKWIDRCFGSLTSSQISNHTILAIDNNSNDNTANLLKSNFPNVILIETGENLGFGKANNIGLKWALENNADHIFLLNQDAWVSNETLKSLIQISLNNPVYGILSPIHMNDEKTIDSEFLKYCYLNLKTEFTFDSLLKKPFKSIYETEFINAAAWLITKECLQNNGGFMPIFPHYGEDGNYCERVINSGLKIGFTPGLTVIHDRDVKARKLSYGKKFNRLYIFLLGVFTSINATDISSSF